MSEPRNTITRLGEGGAIGAGLAVIPGTDTNKQCKLPAAAGNRALGLSFIKTLAAGQPVTIIDGGHAKAIAAAAIAVGDPVEVADTAGKLRTAAPTAGTKANVLGFALTSASADGDEIDVLVQPSIMTEPA